MAVANAIQKIGQEKRTKEKRRGGRVIVRQNNENISSKKKRKRKTKITEKKDFILRWKRFNCDHGINSYPVEIELNASSICNGK